MSTPRTAVALLRCTWPVASHVPGIWRLLSYCWMPKRRWGSKLQNQRGICWMTWSQSEDYNSPILDRRELIMITVTNKRWVLVYLISKPMVSVSVIWDCHSWWRWSNSSCFDHLLFLWSGGCGFSPLGVSLVGSLSREWPQHGGIVAFSWSWQKSSETQPEWLGQFDGRVYSKG